MTPNGNSNGYKIPGAQQDAISPWGEHIALWYQLSPDPTDRFKSIQTPGTDVGYWYDGSTFASFNAIATYKQDVKGWRARQQLPDFNVPIPGTGSFPVGDVSTEDAKFLEWCVVSNDYDMLLFYKVLSGTHGEIANQVAYGYDHLPGFDGDAYQGPMRALVAPFRR